MRCSMSLTACSFSPISRSSSASRALAFRASRSRAWRSGAAPAAGPPRTDLRGGGPGGGGRAGRRLRRPGGLLEVHDRLALLRRQRGREAGLPLLLPIEEVLVPAGIDEGLPVPDLDHLARE